MVSRSLIASCSMVLIILSIVFLLWFVLYWFLFLLFHSFGSVQLFFSFWLLCCSLFFVLIFSPMSRFSMCLPCHFISYYVLGICCVLRNSFYTVLSNTLILLLFTLFSHFFFFFLSRIHSFYFLFIYFPRFSFFVPNIILFSFSAEFISCHLQPLFHPRVSLSFCDFFPFFFICCSLHSLSLCYTSVAFFLFLFPIHFIHFHNTVHIPFSYSFIIVSFIFLVPY